MRINTNITALNSHRMLERSSLAAGRNLEKLSSGTKINRSSDDAAGLAIKTGNAAVLRGGSDAIFSNKIITKVLSSALKEAGLPDNSVSLVDITDRESVDILLKMNSYLDVVIPRGGAGLIKKVVETSTVPVIETGIGICHTFIDESADF